MNKRQAKKRRKFIEEKSKCVFPQLIKSWSHLRWEKYAKPYLTIVKVGR